VINPAWTQFSYAPGYHYDVLRELDYLRSAHFVPDERVAEAIGIVALKRGSDGRWILENPHPDELDFEMDEGEGKPSRWNTLRAMRVLRWYDPAQRLASSGSGSGRTGQSVQSFGAKTNWRLIDEISQHGRSGHQHR